MRSLEIRLFKMFGIKKKKMKLWICKSFLVTSGQNIKMVTEFHTPKKSEFEGTFGII